MAEAAPGRADFAALRAAVADRSARLAVVGLGYVGVPVACAFAEAGFDVLGLDIDADKVRAVNEGRVPFEGREPHLDALLDQVVGAGALRARTEPEALADRDVVLVAVETPVDRGTLRPAYAALRSALAAIGPQLRAGRLVIVESTLAPATTRDVVVPILEASSGLSVGVDLLVAHCPERVMPGRLLANLRDMSRVVGGVTPEAAAVARALYATVVAGDLDETDALTAEIVKSAENAYRDVQIAFANELALLCDSLGADVWQVRPLVNKSPGRAVLLPGAGVGGHCIPKDPWLLVANASPAFGARLIPAARAVNDAMPLHMASLVAGALAGAGRDVAGSRIAVLGYAYLEDSDDDRNTPTAPFVAALAALGAEVSVHDPWVPAYREPDLVSVATGADALAVMVAHQAYRDMDLAALRAVVRTPVLVDGRRAVDPEAAAAAGFLVRTLGAAAA